MYKLHEHGKSKPKKGGSTMRAAVFDYNDNDFITPFNNKVGVDSKGNLMRRLDDYVAMDMNSGKFHYTSPWPEDDNNK